MNPFEEIQAGIGKVKYETTRAMNTVSKTTGWNGSFKWTLYPPLWFFGILFLISVT